MSGLISSDRGEVNIKRVFDAQTGALDRRIFTDETVYQQELRNIFGRAWNFVCHESMLPEPGSFFMSYIGEDEVICVRDREQRINVLLNTCPHRGNTVCRAELGNTRSFFCSYHGWNFDLDGSLLAVPGEDAFYGDALDRSRLGLTAAAQVESYRGFVFATLDPLAPPLQDYLGWVGRLGIDLMMINGDIRFQDGVHKNRLQCNWKIAVDNLFDWYHVKVSHGTAYKIGVISDEAMSPMEQMVIMGEYGHAISGPGVSQAEQQRFDERMRDGSDAGAGKWWDRHAMQRMDPAVRERLGPVGTRCFGHPNIFPNLWVSLTKQLCLRIPRGPYETELWWFSYLPVDISEEQRRFFTFQQNHMFGPAGFLEQDDGENWSHSTRGARGTFSKHLPVNLSMGGGRDEVLTDESGQSRVETVVNEHGQRWTYQSWQDWMSAESWPELMANATPPPAGKV